MFYSLYPFSSSFALVVTKCKCFAPVLSRSYSSISSPEEPSRPAQEVGEPTLVCWPPRASMLNAGASRTGTSRRRRLFQRGRFFTMQNSISHFPRFLHGHRSWRQWCGRCRHEDVAASCCTQRQSPREGRRPQRKQPESEQLLRGQPAPQKQQAYRPARPSESPTRPT